MDFNPIILSIPLYFSLIAIEWIYDLVKKKGIYRMADAYANIGSGIFEQVTGVFAKVFTIGVYVFVYEQFRLMDIPTTWPYLILLWLAVDFSYYWAHRWSHTVNLFWMGHIVHHQSEDYNFSVALRQGVFQKVFTFWVYIPMAILGFDPTWFVIIGALNTVYQFWIHTEQIDRLGWFELIFNTPSHHRVHHGRNPKYIDKNHAGSLIIWDKLFGTFQAEEERPVYGVTKPAAHWDPVSAHFQPFSDMFRDLKKVKGMTNKIGILVNAPGWLPDEYGGMRYPSEVSKEEYVKFDVNPPSFLKAYLFVQFLFVLAASAYFLFSYTAQSGLTNLYWALGITFSITSLGLLFEMRKFAWLIEILRLIVLLIFLSLINDPLIKIIAYTLLFSSLLLMYKSKKLLTR